MANCTLTLYKNAKIENNKNDIIEDIETYLATLTSYTLDSSFQYQRFELDKTIKVNLSQDYQTKATNINKYNYCKFTTDVTNDTTQTVTYYYFITKTKQTAQKTIELTLRMDTLNTFKYKTTAGNDGYTLSEKTTVTREHKDRWVKELIYSDEVLPKKRVGGIMVYTQDPVAHKKYAVPVQYVIDSQTWEATTSFGIGIGTGHGESKYTFTVYNNDGSLNVTRECHNAISVTPYDDSVDFTVTLLDDTTELLEVFPNMYAVIEFSHLSSNATALSHIKDLFEYCNMRGNPVFLYKRKVDQYQEGLGTTLFKQGEQGLLDNDNDNHWYMIYSSQNAVVHSATDTAATYVNPVAIRFYKDNEVAINSSSKKLVRWYPEDFPKYDYSAEYITITKQFYKECLTNVPAAGQYYIVVNGTTYDMHDVSTFTFYHKNNSDVYFEHCNIYMRDGTGPVIYNNVLYFDVYGIASFREYGENVFFPERTIATGAAESTSGTIKAFDEVDLTDPKLIKCFVFPYCPSEWLAGKNTITSMSDLYVYDASETVELDNSQFNDFNREIKFNDVDNPQYVLLDNVFQPAQKTARNKEYESKLLHSDFYQPKFVYDSFGFNFNLENVNINEWLANYEDYKDFTVDYFVSGNVQSKFAFKFKQYICSKSMQDFHDVLCIERNNEKALYSNAYINYIRSGGYSYDTKKANSQNAVNGITTALSIVGAVASFASSAVTGGAGVAAGVGLTTSALAGITRGIYTAQEQDKAIAQKINDSIIQGTSVAGNEDLDILTAISGNKAKLVTYKLSNVMENAVWDLFHYCGYSTYEQKVPQIDTRMYFNFVQADIVFDDYSFNEDIAEDIKNRWKQGVTFFHKVKNSSNVYYYDIDQEYENFEVSLL